ncbi:MAG: hypothetical protein GX753_06080 [Erysipelothrix sp.]|nr:hypothetical protein [Erysipelothrix sp.]
MKKRILLILFILCSCSAPKDQQLIIRKPVENLTSITRENTQIFILDDINLATDFAITSTGKIVGREAESIQPPLDSKEYYQYPDGLEKFIIHVEDFKTRTLLKTIDVNKILEPYINFGVVSSEVRVYEDEENEYAQIRIFRKSFLTPSDQTPDSKSSDFSSQYVSYLYINLDSEDHNIVSLVKVPDDRVEDQYIPTIFQFKNDKDRVIYPSRITYLSDVRTAFGGKEIRLVQSVSDLPEQNRKLYALYPELKELKDEYDKEQIANNYAFDSDHQKAYVIYFYDYVDEDEILSYFIEEATK